MAAKRKKPAPAPAPEPRTVDLPPLSIRAEVKSVNEESRTVDLVFSTGAAVERMDWWTGKRYLETLSLEEGHVRIDRLNEGGPLLDSHNAYSVGDMLGAVVPGSVTLAKKEARVRVQFSRRENVEPIWQDVRDGLIPSVSVGYRVYKFEETEGKGNAIPVRHAVDWEPFEVSMVPIPADAGARVREGDKADTNSCVITGARRQEATMKRNETPAETIAENDPLAPEPEERATEEPQEPNPFDQGVEQERGRTSGILTACRAARVPQSFAQALIDEKGLSLVEAQKRIFAELAKRNAGGVPNEGSRPPSIAGGDDDPFVHVRAGIENALLNRMAPDLFKLEDKGKRYRGMTLFDVARSFLNQQGVRTTELTKMEIAAIAMGLRAGGMHTTSDFANLLADLPGKILRQAYEEAPQTFAPIVRRMTVSDFKKFRLLQLGASPVLLEVGEHGEFTEGTIGESKEESQLKTWGRKFSITRQALVNDDTDAFSRVPMGFGRQARNKESDLVWAEINNNALMGDGVALFSTTTHVNLAAAGGAIDVTTIGAGRASMRAQKDIDAVTPLNINPLYLIVPVAKETIADQFVNPIQPNVATSVNPFAGRLSVIAEPRLDATSATAWYLAGSTSQIDVIALVFLEGAMGPTVESRIGFDVDGIEIKVRHDVVAKVVDFRGLYKNPGA